MATETTVILTDSLDPRIQTGVETVTFFDPTSGEKLEIELGEANRKHFAAHLEKLVKYIAAAEVVKQETPAKPKAAKSDENTKIREWAKQNGYTIGDRGRIKAEIVEAYNKAQAVPAVEDSEPVKLVELSDEAPEALEISGIADLSDEAILAAMAELEAEGKEITVEQVAAKVDSEADSK